MVVQNSTNNSKSNTENPTNKKNNVENKLQEICSYFKVSVEKSIAKQIFDKWINLFEGDSITEVVPINIMLKHLDNLKNNSDTNSVII